MHGVWAVFKYGGDESGREIGGDILDVELLPSDPFPKSGQSIGRLALTHMENPTALEINYNSLVHMPFSDGKLVYADAVHSLKRGRSIVTLKMVKPKLNPREANNPLKAIESRLLSHETRRQFWETREAHQYTQPLFHPMYILPHLARTHTRAHPAIFDFYVHLFTFPT